MTKKLKNEINEYYIELCNRLNLHIPCKSQKDIDDIVSLLKEMEDSPPKLPKPKLYWSRKVWIDCNFDDNSCWEKLKNESNIRFVPSYDIEEHPGVVLKYKTENI